MNWFGSSAVTFGLEGLWVSIDQDDDNNFDASSGPLRRLAERRSMCSCRGATTSTDFFVARAKLNFKFGTY